MKRCNECRTFKPLEDFYRFKRAPDGRQYKCKPCNRRVKREWEAANPDKLRAQQWAGDLGRYGLTPEDYERMNTAQGGLCAVCGGVDPGGQRLHVDHCHESNKVRGLLCGPCNRGLGMYKDSTALLQSAIMYLLQNTDTPAPSVPIG